MGTDSLADRYEALLFDLDGTLYVGGQAILGAVDVLAQLHRARLFITNNASRKPEDVAEHLAELGFSASGQDVVTSAQAAAHVLSQRLPAGAAVLVVGTDALRGEVANVGLRPVRRFDEDVDAVVQGHSTETCWPILAEAAYAIRSGALWVASNTDTTLPTERGLAPGNGAMVAALRTATGAEPVVAGKPAPPLIEDALARVGTRSALVVGDRLDTDIAGANAVGIDSLLVLTGVSTADDLFRADPSLRPTFVSFGLDALHQPVEDPDSDWRVSGDGENLILAGAGDPLSALVAVARQAWQRPNFAAVEAADDNGAQAISAWAPDRHRRGPAGRALRATESVIG
ncbi:HAD-IIA family hydrolase [Skermania sp. ID1734]|uniref:HAD-IIA family hydrolase n=1 Tax=Skermania sp. ID1734 TaxID=2597516 RepID=UPI0011812F2A|nr:HAD-IIA family hydrolase [Skermania sp. ID1734]TSE01383.1 HAD-IIA family hydrolase [Skermania sp. ID1734]